MALKSNRVGVRIDQVDDYGRVISKTFLQSLIDHLPRWTSLKVWKNGTEQLLPVNTDEPVTSPIVADIQYPTDSSATEHMFTYRKSPTDVDGEAYIQSIKGNTLVWNQQLRNGDFSDGKTYWSTQNGTITANNNVGTFTATAQDGQCFDYIGFNLNVNHKYLSSCQIKTSSETTDITLRGGSTAVSIARSSATTEWQTLSGIFTNSSFNYYIIRDTRASGWDAIQIRNCMLFDLTLMFGAGKEPTTVEEFTALFPLSYYQYDAGSLLSFNGTGIKTTDKNLFTGESAYTRENAGYYITRANSNDPLPLSLFKGTYTISIKSTVSGTGQLELFGDTISDRIIGPYISIIVGVKTYTFTIDRDSSYIRFYGNFVGTISDIQIEIGSTATDYEPYTTSTTTIPTSTYFPTGMKSAGTVYDEFVSSRAYTRVGQVDLGSLTWTKVGAISMFYAVYNTDGKFHTGNELPNIKTALYEVCSATTMYNNRNGIITDDVITVNAPFLSPTEQRIVIADTSYTDADVLKTALNGVMLQYELAEEIIEPTLTFDEE